MKICDFCLEEQGVFEVQAVPHVQDVKMSWGNNREAVAYVLDLCEKHQEMIVRCWNRRYVP